MNKKIKIYDCFLFNNEIELLKIRLEELYNFVDYFVIVEANKTFSGKKKTLYFKSQKSKFKKYKNKIIYIPVNNPNFNILDKIYIWIRMKIKNPKVTMFGFLFGFGTWRIQTFQRNQLKKGLTNCENNDIILLSDLDEIINKNIILEIKENCKNNKLILIEQDDYKYFLNGKLKNKWIGTKAITLENLEKYYCGKVGYIRYGLIYAIRKKFNLNPKIVFIKNGGWHFSYIGGIKKIMEKLKSVAHIENNTPEINNKKNIKKCLDKGIMIYDNNQNLEYVKIDKTFPETIYKNKEKYKHLIK